MWRTSTGIRTLHGAEADLVRAAIIDLLAQIQEEADGLVEVWTTGVRLFDELSWQQRLALVAHVADALLVPSVPPPPLTAVNEATIGAIFAYLRYNIELELDWEEAADPADTSVRYYWRRLIAGCQPGTRENSEFWVEEDSIDRDDWDVLVESLQDDILWDDDWDVPELFLDVEPELSRDRRERLGIMEDYFIAPAPDPRAEDLPVLVERLRAILAIGRSETAS